MPTKKGTRAKSSSPKRSTGSGLGKRGKKSSSAKGKKNKVAPLTPLTTDILSPSAMLNLNYIAHNAPDALTMRGFPYTGPRAKKGKKGGGKSAKGGKGKKKKKK